MRPSAKLTWLAAILFPVVMLLLFANALLFDTQTYQSLLQPGAYTTTLQVLNYFNDKAPVPSVFNAAEQSHLADVKRVIRGVVSSSLVLFIVFLALLSFSDQRKALTRGFWLLLIIALLLAFTPFDAVFTRFHELFFPQGNWMFASDSMLILLYPASFFQAFFAHLLALALVFSSILALSAHISLVQHNNP